MTRAQHKRAIADVAAIHERLTCAKDDLNRHEPLQRQVWSELDLAEARLQRLGLYLYLVTGEH
jgi:hypothetical protein